MTIEPKRLVDEDPEFARLVAASEDDLPSPARVDEAVVMARGMVSAARSRTWRWLGSGTAIVGASMLGLFAVTNISSGTQHVKATATAAPVVTVTPPTPEPTLAQAGVPEEPAEPAEAAPAPSASSVMPPVVPTRARPRLDAGAESTTSSRPALSTFDEELALLVAARSGLETRDVRASLDAVERYESRFRSGLFTEEMQVIRIDALATSGEHAHAHALAERFLAANPRSTYAARVRSLAERTRD